MPDSAITRSRQTAGESALTFARPPISHYGLLSGLTISDDGALALSWFGGRLRTPAGNDITILPGSGTCTDDVTNYLVWISGTSLTLRTTGATHGTEVEIAHIACQNTDIWAVHSEPAITVLVPDIQHGLAEIFPLTVAFGCLVSEDVDATDPLDVTVSAGEYYHDLHDEHIVSAFDTRTADTLIRCYIDGAAPETWNFTADGAQSEIDIANWNSGTSLIGTSVGKYYKGLFLISEDNVFWVYAQEQHNNVAAAIAGALPSIPPGLDGFPRSVAYVYKHGDTTFEASTSDRWIDVRPLVTGSVGAGPISDHGNLVGLSDAADHAYAFLHDGTRPLTGELDAAGNDIKQVGQFLDILGAPLLDFSFSVFAVNSIRITNRATGFGPIISAHGGDANLDLILNPQGTGRLISTAVAEAPGLHLEEEGTAKFNLDIMQIVNTVNAADMDGTATSMLFRQAANGGTVYDMGRFKWETKTDWTTTAGDRDGKLTIQVVHDGVLRDKLVIGGNVGVADFLMEGNSTFYRDGTLTAIFSAHSDPAAQGVNVSIRRSRNERASPNAVVDGDFIGQFAFYGHDGSSYHNRARVLAKVDGTVVDGTNAVPMSLSFMTGSTSSPVDRLIIDSSGDVLLVTSGVRLTFSTANEYIEHSGGGRLLYNTAAGTGHRFAVAGSALVELDTDELRLYAGVSLKGAFKWAGTTVSLFHAADERWRLSATHSSVKGRVSIGPDLYTPPTSAVLELRSTIGALLLSRLTTTQRNALTAVNGMALYNDTTNDFNFYRNGSWQKVTNWSAA